MVVSPPSDQLIVIPLFDHLASMQHEDTIALLDRREPVRDGDRRAP